MMCLSFPAFALVGFLYPGASVGVVVAFAVSGRVAE